MSPRESFLAALYCGPLLRADAVVVLAGEDGEARLATGFALLAQGAAPELVLTGKLDHPPSKFGAERLRGMAMARGLAPDRIRVDAEATNTKEQAQDVVAMAKVSGWRTLLLVASAYHLPRATLTFVARLRDVGMDEEVRIVPVPADGPWFQAPPGCEATRTELLDVEFAKIEAYGAQGDVASYEDGLAYLARWESPARAAA